MPRTISQHDLSELLTNREQDVLRLIVAGASNKEIAASLFFTVGTVKWYAHQIYEKLGVSNRYEASKMATLLGWFQDYDYGRLRSHDISIPTTPLIGRASEIQQMQRILVDDSTRLVTILGAGGMGKTRLALAIAGRIVNDSAAPADGVYFISLAAIRDVTQLAPLIAEALDYEVAQSSGSQDATQQLLSYLSRREMLLILDNFEHVLEGATFIAEILKVAPGVKILATSRERLQIQVEQLFPIGGLSLPDSDSVLAAAAGQLFLAVAQRNRPNLAVAEEGQRRHLAEICRLVAGMPLALELAAGWTDVLTLADIVAELRQGIDLLETEARDVPVRHRSVRAAIDYSWRRLTAREKEIWAGLAIFRGRFTREATAAVTGAKLQALAGLVRKSVLHFDADANRYWLHELLRQYGEEKLLEMGHYKARRVAYYNYYLQFVADRELDVKGQRQLEAYEEIKADYGAIRTAWQWALADQEFNLLASAWEALVVYFSKEFHIVPCHELRQGTLDAIEAQDVDPRPAIWYKLSAWHGHLVAARSAPSAADVAAIQGTLAYARQAGEAVDVVTALNQLTMAQIMSGNLDDVLPWLDEAKAIAEQVNSSYLKAMLGETEGRYYLELGRIAEAQATFEQVVDLMVAQGDHLGAGQMQLISCRTALWDQGDFRRAQHQFEKVIIFYDLTKRRHIVAYNHVFLGYLALLRGEFARADRLAQVAWDGLSDSGDDYYLDHVLCLQGLLAVVRGDGKVGRDLLQRFGHLAYRPKLQPALRAWGLATAALAAGQIEESSNYLAQSIEYALAPPREGLLAIILSLSPVLFWQRNEAERAIELLALVTARMGDWSDWLAVWPIAAGMRPALEETVGPADFAATWEKGGQLALLPTANALLAELRTE